jgi:hypothetical protein
MMYAHSKSKFVPTRKMTCFTYKNGSVHTNSGHVRHTIIFSRADQLDKNVENMIKDFKVVNVKPSTASSLLHHMDDMVYDPKAISNVVAKAKKMWLSERGIDTKAASAQVLVDYLALSPDCSCVFSLHDPDPAFMGGAKKGRPQKSSPVSVVTKDFNIQVVHTELISDISEEQYANARREALYLPESDCLLLYAAWITNKELRNTIMFQELLAVDTTGDTNSEDGMLMIVTGLENMRRNFPSIRAFVRSCLLNASGCFIFFSFVFPILFGGATIRRIKQVTQIELHPIVTQWLNDVCINLTQFIFDIVLHQYGP